MIIKNERSFFIEKISMIKITPLESGKARMKAAQKTGRPGRSPVGRKIDIFCDTTWVEPFPILSFLIEHPEGRFLVDTGDVDF